MCARLLPFVQIPEGAWTVGGFDSYDVVVRGIGFDGIDLEA
jgi:hypothetical protein